MFPKDKKYYLRGPGEPDRKDSLDWYEPDGSQWALNFDATNKYLERADAGNIFINTPITHGCRFRQSGNPQDAYGILMWKGGSSAVEQRIGLQFHVSSTTLLVGRMRINGGLSDLTSDFPQTQKDHTVILSYDGSTQKLYNDGILASSRAISGTIDAGLGTPLNIGGLGVTNSFSGLVLETFVCHHAVSLSEAKGLQEGALSPADLLGLKHWLNYNDGHGTTKVRDWSAENLDMSMQNFSGNEWVNVGIQ